MAQEEFEVAGGYKVHLEWADGKDTTKEVEFTCAVFNADGDEVYYSDYEGTLEDARCYGEGLANEDIKEAANGGSEE